MEKKYLIPILIFLQFCFCKNIHSQIVRPGLISSQGTIAVGSFLKVPSSPFYLHGSLDAFLQKNVSYFGEIYWYLGELNKSRQFDYHHSLFWGLKYHLVKNNHDLILGIAPGISMTKINQTHILIVSENKRHIGINPQMAVILGYRFYVHRFFHVFAEGKYLAGTHNMDQKTSLSELRFSAGLGFNLNLLKAK